MSVTLCQGTRIRTNKKVGYEDFEVPKGDLGLVVEEDPDSDGEIGVVWDGYQERGSSYVNPDNLKKVPDKARSYRMLRDFAYRKTPDRSAVLRKKAKKGQLLSVLRAQQGWVRTFDGHWMPTETKQGTKILSLVINDAAKVPSGVDLNLAQQEQFLSVGESSPLPDAAAAATSSPLPIVTALATRQPPHPLRSGSQSISILPESVNGTAALPAAAKVGPLTWTRDQVRDWVLNLDPKEMKKASEMFWSKGVTGEILLELKRNDLKQDYPVKKSARRKLIIDSIGKLKGIVKAQREEEAARQAAAQAARARPMYITGSHHTTPNAQPLATPPSYRNGSPSIRLNGSAKGAPLYIPHTPLATRGSVSSDGDELTGIRGMMQSARLAILTNAADYVADIKHLAKATSAEKILHKIVEWLKKQAKREADRMQQLEATLLPRKQFSDLQNENVVLNREKDNLKMQMRALAMSETGGDIVKLRAKTARHEAENNNLKSKSEMLEGQCRKLDSTTRTLSQELRNYEQDVRQQVLAMAAHVQALEDQYRQKLKALKKKQASALEDIERERRGMDTKKRDNNAETFELRKSNNLQQDQIKKLKEDYIRERKILRQDLKAKHATALKNAVNALESKHKAQVNAKTASWETQKRVALKTSNRDEGKKVRREYQDQMDELRGRHEQELQDLREESEKRDSEHRRAVLKLQQEKRHMRTDYERKVSDEAERADQSRRQMLLNQKENASKIEQLARQAETRVKMAQSEKSEIQGELTKMLTDQGAAKQDRDNQLRRINQELAGYMKQNEQTELLNARVNEQNMSIKEQLARHRKQSSMDGRGMSDQLAQIKKAYADQMEQLKQQLTDERLEQLQAKDLKYKPQIAVLEQKVINVERDAAEEKRTREREYGATLTKQKDDADAELRKRLATLREEQQQKYERDLDAQQAGLEKTHQAQLNVSKTKGGQKLSAELQEAQRQMRVLTKQKDRERQDAEKELRRRHEEELIRLQHELRDLRKSAVEEVEELRIQQGEEIADRLKKQRDEIQERGQLALTLEREMMTRRHQLAFSKLGDKTGKERQEALGTLERERQAQVDRLTRSHTQRLNQDRAQWEEERVALTRELETAKRTAASKMDDLERKMQREMQSKVAELQGQHQRELKEQQAQRSMEQERMAQEKRQLERQAMAQLDEQRATLQREANSRLERSKQEIETRHRREQDEERQTLDLKQQRALDEIKQLQKKAGDKRETARLQSKLMELQQKYASEKTELELRMAENQMDAETEKRTLMKSHQSQLSAQKEALDEAANTKLERERETLRRKHMAELTASQDALGKAHRAEIARVGQEAKQHQLEYEGKRQEQEVQRLKQGRKFEREMAQLKSQFEDSEKIMEQQKKSLSQKHMAELEGQQEKLRREMRSREKDFQRQKKLQIQQEKQEAEIRQKMTKDAAEERIKLLKTQYQQQMTDLGEEMSDKQKQFKQANKDAKRGQEAQEAEIELILQQQMAKAKGLQGAIQDAGKTGDVDAINLAHSETNRRYDSAMSKQKNMFEIQMQKINDSWSKTLKDLEVMRVKQVKDLERQNEGLRTDNQDLQDEVEQANERIEQLEKTKDSYKKQLLLAKKQVKKLKKSNQELDDENERLEEVNKTLVMEFESQITSLQIEKNEMQEQHAEAMSRQNDAARAKGKDAKLANKQSSAATREHLKAVLGDLERDVEQEVRSQERKMESLSRRNKRLGDQIESALKVMEQNLGKFDKLFNINNRQKLDEQLLEMRNLTDNGKSALQKSYEEDLRTWFESHDLGFAAEKIMSKTGYRKVADLQRLAHADSELVELTSVSGMSVEQGRAFREAVQSIGRSGAGRRVHELFLNANAQKSSGLKTSNATKWIDSGETAMDSSDDAADSDLGENKTPDFLMSANALYKFKQEHREEFKNKRKSSPRKSGHKRLGSKGRIAQALTAEKQKLTDTKDRIAATRRQIERLRQGNGSSSRGRDRGDRASNSSVDMLGRNRSMYSQDDSDQKPNDADLEEVSPFDSVSQCESVSADDSSVA